MSVASTIDKLKDEMQAANIKPECGLGMEMFLFSSTLMPVVNVDLLVTNTNHEVLLAWRDDPHAGTGWHIPGGCVRFKEKLTDRVQKTAIAELGVEVFCQPEPIRVFEIFLDDYREGLADQNERTHFITLVFACKMKNESGPLEREKNFYEGRQGYLKWFTELPENLLNVQQCYKNSWEEIRQKLWQDDAWLYCV